MLNYWDLAESERAKLTEQQLEDFVAAECMHKGVLRAKPLELVTAPEMPEPDQQAYVLDLGYHAKLAFTMLDAAQTVAGLVTTMVDTTYLNGQHVPHLKALRDLDVKAVAIYSEERVLGCRSAIEKATAAKQENERREAEWQKARKAEHDALRGLYEDWHRCGALDTRMRKIAATFAEYEAIAGDRDKAARFLTKVFAVSEIKQAAEWCGVDIPDPEAPIYEPAPEPEAAAADITF